METPVSLTCTFLETNGGKKEKQRLVIEARKVFIILCMYCTINIIIVIIFIINIVLIIHFIFSLVFFFSSCKGHIYLRSSDSYDRRGRSTLSQKCTVALVFT